MALEVTVGPPVLTINNGHTFLVTELDGSITHASDQGLYSSDTRYLSGYQLYINGKSCSPRPGCRGLSLFSVGTA